ncbi:LysR family transcriptional regulator [Pseudooceanicola nanhaiensis]|uniref:LysR family transcriptional regulator n=1 Tax=Pseudooceanicola nanhaiensis TaxID=375761 RepID=UPI001CD721DA|nr:LysR family transcriptional regulator [Pseudooceanicola nanhaiensis]MCA0920410.1 LysR family transcriptional regulator [Pseudooceanicola nanhaiensis]
MADPSPLRTPLADPAHFRLLVALDALLVEGSVGRAAARMGLSSPAMSRMLKQLRAHYGDPLFERTGSGMIPTAFAEDLRLRLRAVISEANALLAPPSSEPVAAPLPAAPAPGPLDRHPPLSLDEAPPQGGGPDAAMLARRLANASNSPEGARRLAGYIAMTGNGAGRTRPMTEEEAEDAFAILLRKDGHPVQLGALMIALQGRGATEAELAGFVRAARDTFGAPAPGSGTTDLDWPAYLSPRMQGAPWFLLAARLVARAGYSVALHGRADGLVPKALQHAGLDQGALERERLRFLAVEDFAPSVAALRDLYRYVQMPTPAQFVLALLNPLGARVSLLGQRQIGRPGLQRDVMRRLGWRQAVVLNGLRDVAQVLPETTQGLFLLHDGEAGNEEVTGPKPLRAVTRPKQDLNRLEYWQAVWDGDVDEPERVPIVLETAVVALRALDPALSVEDARAQAAALWSGRRRSVKLIRKGG